MEKSYPNRSNTFQRLLPRGHIHNAPETAKAIAIAKHDNRTMPSSEPPGNPTNDRQQEGQLRRNQRRRKQSAPNPFPTRPATRRRNERPSLPPTRQPPYPARTRSPDEPCGSTTCRPARRVAGRRSGSGAWLEGRVGKQGRRESRPKGRPRPCVRQTHMLPSVCPCRRTGSRSRGAAGLLAVCVRSGGSACAGRSVYVRREGGVPEKRARRLLVEWRRVWPCAAVSTVRLGRRRGRPRTGGSGGVATVAVPGWIACRWEACEGNAGGGGEGLGRLDAEG
jgi:hypothetical protein